LVTFPDHFLNRYVPGGSDKAWIFHLKCSGWDKSENEEPISMKSTGTLTFALFVIVVLAAIFWLMHGRGQTQWGLVAVLLGVLVLRVALFVINLRQQRHNAEAGKGPVRIETRLGLGDDEPEATETSSAQSPSAPER
jgi:hypothetical protein